MDPLSTSQTKQVDGSKGYHLFSNRKLIGNIELGVWNDIIANCYKILIQGIGNLRSCWAFIHAWWYEDHVVWSLQENEPHQQ